MPDADADADADAPLPTPSSWRTIEQLAERVGGYCWREHRLFELTGSWASGEGDPVLRIYCSALSARHAARAARWRDRLPVRAGVDAAALIVAPAGWADALTALEGEPDLLLRFGGLVDVVVPSLLATYGAHLDRAWPVNEGPVIEVLRLIDLSGEREVQQGRDLLEQGVKGSGPGNPAPDRPDRSADLANFCQDLRRALDEPRGIIPAAWAS
jgi:hypothetical protein